MSRISHTEQRARRRTVTTAVAISALAVVACGQDGPTAPTDKVVNLDFVRAVVPCSQIVVRRSCRSDVNVADMRLRRQVRAFVPQAHGSVGSVPNSAVVSTSARESSNDPRLSSQSLGSSM
jgi:hypothetical protein